MVSMNRPKPGHEQIANDVVRFLANGGVIRKCANGETANYIRYRRSKASNSHYVRVNK